MFRAVLPSLLLLLALAGCTAPDEVGPVDEPEGRSMLVYVIIVSDVTILWCSEPFEQTLLFEWSSPAGIPPVPTGERTYEVPPGLNLTLVKPEVDSNGLYGAVRFTLTHPDDEEEHFVYTHSWILPLSYWAHRLDPEPGEYRFEWTLAGVTPALSFTVTGVRCPGVDPWKDWLEAGDGDDALVRIVQTL